MADNTFTGSIEDTICAISPSDMVFSFTLVSQLEDNTSSVMIFTSVDTALVKMFCFSLFQQGEDNTSSVKTLTSHGNAAHISPPGVSFCFSGLMEVFSAPCELSYLAVDFDDIGLISLPSFNDRIILAPALSVILLYSSILLRNVRFT